VTKTRIASLIALIATVSAVLWGWSYYEKIKPFRDFTRPDTLTENFRATFRIFGGTTIEAPQRTLAFRQLEGISLPDSFNHKGQSHSLSSMLDSTYTTGFLVAVDDQIVFEQYYRGEKESDRHIMFSVSKSFVSALVGIALEEGHFDSIEDPITKYLPELSVSGYDGVRIKDILQMSSGVYFNEDYNDPLSDVNQMGLTIATGGSLNEFALSLENKWPPGSYNNYVSVDTHVLGMLLTRITGQSLSSYLQDKIWQPLGMEFDGHWQTDGLNMEMAMGGLNVALRDMARMGRLYLHRGAMAGEQIVPANWVAASVTPDAPHLLPGPDNPGSSNPFGYGYQWWTPTDPRGDFFAAGIYYQYIYVDPASRVVIAKTSADVKFTDPDEPRKMALQIAAFQAISAHIAAQLRDDTTREQLNNEAAIAGRSSLLQ
jgi:CubicO group peptidase (beta-lactamase class C family)